MLIIHNFLLKITKGLHTEETYRFHTEGFHTDTRGKTYHSLDIWYTVKETSKKKYSFE